MDEGSTRMLRGFAITAFLLAAMSAARGDAPSDLRVELRRAPLGFEARRPSFSWVVNHPPDGGLQKACRIQVAARPEALAQERDLAWDSGRIDSDRSVGVPYAGRPLEAATPYVWRVRTWDEKDRPSPWSDPAPFVTGLWDACRAKWIWARDRTDNQHVFLRKTVPAGGGPPARVLAFVSADDYVKLYVNGRFVGQGPAPGFPDRGQHVVVFDLTPFWRGDAPNVVAAHAYYQGLRNYAWVSGDDRRGFLLQVEILRPDGSRDRVVTDTSWKALTSDARTARHRFGYDTGFSEDIDARKIPVGGTEPGFDDAAWPAAVEQDAARWSLRMQDTDPLDVYPLAPIRATKSPDGRRLFDFGREVVGTLRLSLTGRGGEIVEVRLGEEMEGPDAVRYRLRANCTYQDFWTLRDGRQSVEQYDYRAFRYAEILNAPPEFSADDVAAVVRHAPFDDRASDFTCDDPRLQALWDLAKYSTKMGTQEIYLDCPTREKAQYTLDGFSEMIAAFYQAGETNRARRMIEQALQSSPEGKLACLAPAGKEHTFTEYGMYPVLMARTYHDFTGDGRFARESWDTLARVEDYFRRTFGRPDGLLQGTDPVLHDLVDWPKERRDGHEILPVNTVVCAVWARLQSDLAGLARAAGRTEDAARLDAGARRTAEAVNAALWDPGSRRYADGMQADGTRAAHGSLHANAFPLAMGVVPPERRTDVVAFVRSRGLRCNLFLAPFLFDALYDQGAEDHALALLTADGPESPMNWIRKGATTTWEVWDLDQKKNASLFHPAGAFVGSLIASRILGVRPLEPGFRRILVRPRPGTLREAAIRIPTVRGPVSFAFAREGDGWRVRLTVPGNATARLEFPRAGNPPFVADPVGPGEHVIPIPAR